jgi:hypothetical protein
VQLISRKLIAPIVGAMVVPCVVGLAAAAAADRTTSTSTLMGTPPFGSAVLFSSLTNSDVLVGEPVALAGTLAPSLAGQTVTLEQRAGRGWRVVAARPSSIAIGSFRLVFRERRLGTERLRLEISGGGETYYTPVTTLTVFHRVLVSWYDLTGRTACGKELGAWTLGVASRTLPCGTRVTFRYRGRTLRVPVIDRGPYVWGRDYDLTYATKLALRAGDLTELWANH